MEKLNYPLAYAPMSIDYPNEDGIMIHIGYIPNLCYVVGLKRKYNSDGTYKSQYEVVFVDKIVDFENKKIETAIPKYEERYYEKCYYNADYADDISFDYYDAEKVCELKNRNLYAIKTFTSEEKLKYLNKLKEHKKLLLNTHSNSYDYKSLELKIGNAKL